MITRKHTEKSWERFGDKGMLKLDQIYCADALEFLRKMPDEYIDTIITSPPYFGLRDYQVDGQIGLESSLDEYIERLLLITAELKRILKKTGVMFWNHGDCYGGRCSWGGETGLDERWSDKRKVHPPGCHQRKLKPKCLALQNYRLVLRTLDDLNKWELKDDLTKEEKEYVIKELIKSQVLE